MEYTFLVRGYAESDMLIWLITIALILVLLGGKWLWQKVTRFIKKRNEQADPTI